MTSEPATRKCPHCAETILKEAKVCKHCRRKLGPSILKIVLITFTAMFVLGLGGCVMFLGAVGNAAKNVKMEEANAEKNRKVYKVKDAFPVGHIGYAVTNVTTRKSIGSDFNRTSADGGAEFVIVQYMVENLGKESETVMSDNFKLVTPDGSTYSPDSQAITALMMMGKDKDFLLSQLNPGVTKNSITAFEVPTTAYKAGTMLEVPASSMFKDDGVKVQLK